MSTRRFRLAYLWIIPVLAAGVGAWFWYAGALAGPSPESEPVMEERHPHASGKPVKIVTVFSHPMTEELTLPGSVEAAEEIDIGAAGEGVVSWVGVAEGDPVKAGQALVRLDTDDLEARVAEAQARLDLARKTFERYQTLLERGGNIERARFDESQAELSLAQANLRIQQVAVSHGAISAPTDGVLDRFDLKVGEFVRRGDPVGKLVRADYVRVTLQVPEKDIGFVSPNQGATVTLDSSIGDRDEETRSGHVDFIALSAEPAARTFPVKVRVDNPDLRLRPGMIAHVKLVRRHKSDAIAVPFFVVIDGEAGRTVFVEEDGVARERRVRLGMIQGGLLEITQGLGAGDRLIVVGQRDLLDGEPVSIQADLTNAARSLVDGGADLEALMRMQL